MALTAAMQSSMFWPAVVWSCLSGIAYIAGIAPFTALLQTIVPNHLQGRVLSLLSTTMGLAAPVGLAMATPLGELIGIRWLLVLLGSLGGAVTVLGFMSPALRLIDNRRTAMEP